MNLDQFDMNLLVALDALLVEKNVTHAGIRLHRTQSSMSGALGRLRELFQDPLLVPVGRKMTLTPLAERLAKPVREILVQTQATIATRQTFDPATSKERFSLAMSDYVASVFMADALREVSRRAPHMTFEIQPLGRRAMEALEEGTVDFLIVMDVFSLPGHPKIRLFEDTHTCIAWEGNTRVGATISRERYLDLGHVTAHIAEAQHPNFEEHFLRRSKFSRRAEVVVMNGSSFLPDLVIGTERIASVPTRLAEKYARVLPLKLVEFPVEMPPIVELLQWHKSHDQDPAFAWLRGILEQQATRLMGPVTRSNDRQPVDMRRNHRDRTYTRAVGRQNQRKATRAVPPLVPL